MRLGRRHDSTEAPAKPRLKGASKIGAWAVGANLAFWILCIALRQPVEASYFGDRQAQFDGALPEQSELVSDADARLILAERPFGDPIGEGENVVIDAALVVNLPAYGAARAVQYLLGGPVLTVRVASWLATVVFFVLSSVQWWWSGEFVMVLTRDRDPEHGRRRSRRPKEDPPA